MTTQPLLVTYRAIEILEAHQVEYCLVGSLATSALGIPRATIDADLIAQLSLAKVTALVADLAASGFYVSEHAAREAVTRVGMFNLIDLATSFKVDIYVLGRRPFDREEFSRRQWRRLSPHSEQEVAVASPEDLVLSKLEWFELGNRVSERQWRDLLGILRVQRQLDWDYLQRWAEELGLSQLLQKARQEAGLTGGDAS